MTGANASSISDFYSDPLLQGDPNPAPTNILPLKQKRANFLQKVNSKINELPAEQRKEKENKLIALHLWHKLICCQDFNKREKIENELAALLSITLPPIRPKHFWHHLRFRKPPVETVVRDAMLEEEMKKRLFLIPSYNKFTRWMNKKITALLAYYKELSAEINKLEEENKKLRTEIRKLSDNTIILEKDEKITANQSRIDEIKPVRKNITHLLFLLNNDQSFRNLKKEEIITNGKVDPGILKIIKSVNTAKHHEFLFYKNELLKTYQTFYAAVNRTKIDDSLVDVPTQNIINLVVRRIGGHDYLQIMFTQEYNGEACPFPSIGKLQEIIDQNSDPNGILTDQIKEHLNNIRKRLWYDFKDIQNTDFRDSGFNIDEEKKRKLVLKPFKRVINRWSASKGLGPALEKIPDEEWEAITCNKLIDELDKNISLLNQEHYSALTLELRGKYTRYQNELTNIVEIVDLAERKRKLKFLHIDLIQALNSTMLPYKEPITLYREVTDPTHVSHAKHAVRKRKRLSDNVSKVATVLLALGQAAVSAYAFLYLVPVLGWVAMALAPVTFFCTLLANTILFGSSTKGTLRQLFVRGDFTKGFKSPGGRLSMLFLSVSAVSLGIVMGVLSYISMIAAIGALGVLFPPILPALPILAPIVSAVIAGTTLLGYTCLMYVSMVTLFEKAYNWMTRVLPEMRGKEGFIQHLKGFKQGCVARHRQIAKNGGYSDLVWRSLVKLFGYYWSNPTGNPDDRIYNPKLVWQKRLEHSFGTVMWALLVSTGVALFAVSFYATLTVWFKEATTFFNGVVHLPMMASKIAAGAVIFTFTAVARCVFSLRNYLRSFEAAAEFITKNIFSNSVKGTQLLLTDPRKFVDTGKDKIANAWKSTKTFFKDISYNKDQTTGWLKYTFYAKIALPAAILFNTVANYALVIKNAIIPAGLGIDEVFDPALANEVSLSSSSAFDHIQATSFALASATANGNAAKDVVTAEPMSYIPLQEVRNARKATQENQEIEKNIVYEGVFKKPTPPPKGVLKQQLPSNSFSSPSDEFTSSDSVLGGKCDTPVVRTPFKV